MDAGPPSDTVGVTPSAPVAIIDDDAAVASSTQALLEAHGVEASVFDSAEAFLEALPGLPESCILLDLKMPGLSGIELQEVLAAKGVDYPVVILTGHGDVTAAVQAMKLGAVDFLEKPCSLDALLNALNSGWKTISDDAPDDTSDRAFEQRLATLTDRERDVLRHLVQGKINKVIAHDLGISQRTVEIHRARIKRKMEARSLADLIAISAGRL
ncbi:MAG: response regulator [Pseudomonadota bacterium]